MTTTTKKIDFDSAANQRICGQLVAREVGHCVSSLVHHFCTSPEALTGSDYNYDELMEICSRQDWESEWENSDGEAFQDSSGDWWAIKATDLPSIKNAASHFADGVAAATADDPFEYDSLDEYRDAMLAFHGESVDDDTDYQALCNAVGIDDTDCYREAYEHWIVSDWFAEKLRGRGEMVGELFGLTIWGRTCTGQAIASDGVISGIAAEMEILQGQKNDWSKNG